MAKSNPLSKALKPAAAAKKQGRKAPEAPAAPATPEATATAQASRVGRVMIGGHFSPDVQRELKIVAAMESKTLQALLAEAFNMLLAKYGRPEIATAGVAENSSAAA